jgi:thiosulfate/3-mercaptopyruvate sulfurtransferase
MPIDVPGIVVSAQWLNENLGADNLLVFDASMKPLFPPANPTVSPPAYIPGSLRFDFDDVLRDQASSLPHMMPSSDLFTSEMQAYGVHADSAIVVYDRDGIYSSPRAWWMLRAMGHDRVAVLDGGLPAWIDAGYETASSLATPKQRGSFVAHPRPGLLVDASAVIQAIDEPGISVIDARSSGRFHGREPEPRPGLRGGHMPGAANIPYTDVLEQGRLASPSTLQAIFDPHQPRMIFSCGSGVTACVLALAATQAGYQDLAVYDGSWSEWGRPDSGLPVTTD